MKKVATGITYNNESILKIDHEKMKMALNVMMTVNGENI